MFVDDVGHERILIEIKGVVCRHAVARIVRVARAVATVGIQRGYLRCERLLCAFEVCCTFLQILQFVEDVREDLVCSGIDIIYS